MDFSWQQGEDRSAISKISGEDFDEADMEKISKSDRIRL